MINWKNPLTERPQDGQHIWIVDFHWKQIFPESYAIHAGVYEASSDETRVRVSQCDEAGHGCAYWNWPTSESGLDCNYVGAWVEAESINIPKWLMEG